MVVKLTRKHWNRKTLQNHLGKKCCNCGSEEDVQYHHIVELAAGGNDVITNLAPICGKCHEMHHSFSGLKNHSLLVKRGIEKRKENGFEFGRPSKMLEERKKYIWENCASFCGSMGDAEIIDALEIGRTRYCEIKRIVAREHGIDKIKQVHRKTI